MYEHITFEKLLRRMLDSVPSDVDTREGSIVYNAIAPATIELQNMYIELDAIMRETFADTASRYYLIKRAAERGLTPYQASKAVLKGEFKPETLAIPTGARFSLDLMNYRVIAEISPGYYQLECESPGIEGNQYFGKLIPIDYIQGLESARLIELLVPGENEEETEHFRQRYFDSLNAQAFGGNIADYKEKVNAIAGVGGVKVYPVWNGGGTVKLVVINSEYEAPTPELVALVQETMDPVPFNGQGVGLAPIGHYVTVEGVEAVAVSVSTVLEYKEGWTWEDVEPYAEEAIDQYFKELAESWANENNLVVRISQIETRLLQLEGVEDIQNTHINSQESNLQLSENCIPVRGVIDG